MFLGLLIYVSIMLLATYTVVCACAMGAAKSPADLAQLPPDALKKLNFRASITSAVLWSVTGLIAFSTMFAIVAFFAGLNFGRFFCHKFVQDKSH